MSDGPQIPVPQIQIAIDPQATQVLYTDVVIVNGSPMGFVLNFGQWAPDQAGSARVYARVGMSPNHMKLLARLLKDNVDGYEAKFGPIAVDESREAPHQHIGFSPKPELHD